MESKNRHEPNRATRSLSRRGFLSLAAWVGVLASGLTALGQGWRFLQPAVTSGPTTVFSLGSLDDFPPGLRRREATAITSFLLTRLNARERVVDVTYLAAELAPSATPAATGVPPTSVARLPALKYNGRQLFEGLECSICHRVGLKGGEVGPALTHIGRVRDAAWLRTC